MNEFFFYVALGGRKFTLPWRCPCARDELGFMVSSCGVVVVVGRREWDRRYKGNILGDWRLTVYFNPGLSMVRFRAGTYVQFSLCVLPTAFLSQFCSILLTLCCLFDYY